MVSVCTFHWPELELTGQRWELALAALRSGIIYSPGPTLLTEKEIEYRCNKTRAKLFIGDATNVAKFLTVQQHCPTVRHVMRVGDGAESHGVVSVYASLESVPIGAKFRSLRQQWSSPAMLYFTSGTSGFPKVVRHNQISYPLGEISRG